MTPLARLLAISTTTTTLCLSALTTSSQADVIEVTTPPSYALTSSKANCIITFVTDTSLSVTRQASNLMQPQQQLEAISSALTYELTQNLLKNHKSCIFSFSSFSDGRLAPIVEPTEVTKDNIENFQKTLKDAGTHPNLFLTGGTDSNRAVLSAINLNKQLNPEAWFSRVILITDQDTQRRPPSSPESSRLKNAMKSLSFITAFLDKTQPDVPLDQLLVSRKNLPKRLGVEGGPNCPFTDKIVNKASMVNMVQHTLQGCALF